VEENNKLSSVRLWLSSEEYKSWARQVLVLRGLLLPNYF